MTTAASDPPVYTMPSTVDKDVVGYIINCGFPPRTTSQLAAVQAAFVSCAPEAIWVVPMSALHCTILDLLTPGADYGEDTDALFRRLGAEYASQLQKVIASQPPIPVVFNALEVHPAGIILRGHDDGSLHRIRTAFTRGMPLLPGTKPLPRIVHVTLARFTQAVPFESLRARIESAVAKPHITHTIGSLRIVRETKVFMLEYDELQSWPLKGKTGSA